MTDKSDLLAVVLEHVSQGVAMFDSARRLVLWNEQYEEILQFPKGFLKLGMPNIDLTVYLAERGDFGEGDPAKLATERLDLIWEQTQSRTEITVRGENTYEALINRTPDDGLVVTYTDITASRQSAEALQQSEERFRDFAASTSDWVWETDAEHRFTQLSERLLNVTNGAAKESIGKTRYEIASNPDDEGWQEHLADLEARNPFRDFCYEYILENGRSVWLSISGRPVYDADGEFMGYRGRGGRSPNKLKRKNGPGGRKMNSGKARSNFAAPSRPAPPAWPCTVSTAHISRSIKPSAISWDIRSRNSWK